MANDIVLSTQNALDLMPVMDIDTALARRGAMVKFVEKILTKDTDFGVIPGTGNKATLLKPGAEKLTTFFGLSKMFEIVERVEDWLGKDHDGEPFFYYLYRCRLYRGDLLVAESDGSCNSFESRYRWRKSERVCPDCKQPTIIKGKVEFGGGWLCYKNKGGCGAKFRDGSAEIESQSVGMVPNPDIASQVNTIQKMAQKRALIAATLLAVNASEFFTQDLEDMADNVPSFRMGAPGYAADVVEGEYRTVQAPPVTPVTPTNGKRRNPAEYAPEVVTPSELAIYNLEPHESLGGTAKAPAVDVALISKVQLKALHAAGNDLYGAEWDQKRMSLVESITKGEFSSASDLTAAQADKLIQGMRDRIAKRNHDAEHSDEQPADNPFTETPEPVAA